MKLMRTISLAATAMASLCLLGTSRDFTLDRNGSVTLTYALRLDNSLATINLAKTAIVLGGRRGGACGTKRGGTVEPPFQGVQCGVFKCEPRG